MSRTLLFFDLDRTLWDFERNSLETLKGLFHEADLLAEGVADFEAFNAVYQRENKACWDDYLAGRMTKPVLRTTRFQRSLECLGVDRPDTARFMGEEYVRRGPHQTHLMDGALDVLAALKARGHGIHILTNGFKEVQHIKVENSGIGAHVDAVWTSDELGALKPLSACFEGALNGAGGRPEDAWMIGDDHTADVVGAHACGWNAIHFAPHGDTPSESPAVASVAHLRELLAILPGA